VGRRSRPHRGAERRQWDKPSEAKDHRPKQRETAAAPVSRINWVFRLWKFCNWHFSDPYEPFLGFAVLRNA